jgi:outer membrane protein OmpA-like peptidoglycan-associated protein
VTQAPKEFLLTVHGRVYPFSDTTSVVPGVEIIFSRKGADSVVETWNDVSKADGSYRVVLPGGHTYRVELAKGGKDIETQEFPTPLTNDDSTAITKNFYLNGIGDTCCIDRVEWKNAYFDTGSATLRRQSIVGMSDVVQFLKNNSTAGLNVEGHADLREVPRGQPNPEQYLLQLGQQRAKAAYAFLVKEGIPESRLSTVSYGAKRPAAPNDTPENRQLNRRVKFKTVGIEFIPSKEEKLRTDSLLKMNSPPIKKSILQNSTQGAARHPVLAKPVLRSSKIK